VWLYTTMNSRSRGSIVVKAPASRIGKSMTFFELFTFYVKPV